MALRSRLNHVAVQWGLEAIAALLDLAAAAEVVLVAHHVANLVEGRSLEVAQNVLEVLDVLHLLVGSVQEIGETFN